MSPKITDAKLAQRLNDLLEDGDASRVEITENQYVEAIVDKAKEFYTRYQTMCEAINILRDKIASGNIMRYYTDGQNIWYEAKEKDHIGFRASEKHGRQ